MKRVRRKGGNKEKVFGCDLMEHLSTTCQEVPHVLRSCSEFIEEHGIVDGIYRLSGVSSNTQKLRSEFDSEGNPDLRKDVYLQDIHCVSSLCKAYFRELPNPLLTYQLYDRFAEAVAVQLEDERLVKIRDVLRDLPPPHFRTLEFLMRHLVKMSTFSAETNMHARNLAIVWAPNLLRSKDIEASGFNGTAAFMEVRVQSIVVEFILTHVPQLFPDTALGVPTERRKSLPSPTLLANQEEFSFKALPFQYPGNMSPGDGPPAMRPYHAIIEPTDKRKGSLKGRRWKSIFNLGGRLPDPRKRNKGSTKEKEKQVLRPAKSMDSLSPGPYEGNRQGASPTQLSPVAPTGHEGGGASGSGGGAGGGLISGSYAVTYRRGGGASVSVVSGGGGTPGTYSRLESAGVTSGSGSDTGGAGGAGGAAPVSRSPALSSRADKRAGIHISGPFSVTVPLHITSGLLGVIQGSRGEEESPAPAPASASALAPAKEEAGENRSRDREKEDAGEEQQEVVRGQSEDAETVEQEPKPTEEEEEGSEGDENTGGGREEEEDGESDGETAQCEEEVEVTPMSIEEKTEGAERSINGQISSEEEEEDDEEEESQEDEEEEAPLEEICESLEGDYVDMRSALQMALPVPPAEGALAAALPIAPAAPPAAPLSVEEEEGPDGDLPLDFQDTFGFLDMMDSSTSQTNNEFSVEPPCFEEEYEYESQSWFESATQAASSPPQQAQLPPQTHTPAVPILPQHTRLTSKSHSLPYKCSPSYPESSEEEEEDDDEAILCSLSDEDEEEEDDDEGPGDYEQMFFRSLPNELEFHGLAWSGPGAEPLAAESSEDVSLGGQSKDTDTLVLSQSDQADPSSASGGVYANQSEEPGEHDYVEMPVTSQDVRDDGQSESSPDTDTSSLANQSTDILTSDQSKCSYVQMDSNGVYMKMTRVRDEGGKSKEEMDEKHGEEKKEERAEKETSCEEGQIIEKERASAEWVLSETTLVAEGDASPDQQDSSPSTAADYRPPLPVRDYHADAEDSQHTYEMVDVVEDEEDEDKEEDDTSDLTTTASLTAPSHGETGTEAGDGSSASERQDDVASCEEHREGEQNGTCQKDGEEGKEMEEEKREDEGEIESDGECGIEGERTKDEVDGDGEKEKNPEEGQEKRTVTEEEQEGNKPPVEEEEKKDEEEEEGEEEDDEEEEEGKQQPNGEERVVVAQKVAEEETTERKEAESEGCERDEGMREGHPDETLQDRDHPPDCMPECQSEHGVSEGRDTAEQLGEEGSRVEEREQMDAKHKTVDGAEEGEWNVREKSDREGKADDHDQVIVLGPGVGRTLVTTKQVPPRTHQVKAVPVVPPKPQQSRLTALNLRQQLQNRDTHTQQRDQDTPHSHTHSLETTTPQQDTHTPDTKTEQPDTHTPDTEAEQQDTHTPKKEAETAQPLQTPDTKSAAQELTDAELHIDCTHDPNPTPTPAGAAAIELHPPPQIVIDQPHQSHMDEPEQPQPQPQPQHSNAAEQQTALPEIDRGAGMSADADRARGEGRGDTDKQGEQQRDRGAGGDRSPDVKKDRLGAREGEKERERERRTKERDGKRNSGMSICFDEAVARATREREREREHGEREKERERGVNVQDEKARL